MKRDIYELKGFIIVLDHVLHVSPVFASEKDEGSQFNIRLGRDAVLNMKFPDRTEAVLQRGLFVEALKG